MNIENKEEVQTVNMDLTQDEIKGILEMTDDEMKKLIKNIYGGPLWIAINRYAQQRINLADTVLRSTDPVKDPSKIASTQGTIAGIRDILVCIKILNG